MQLEAGLAAETRFVVGPDDLAPAMGSGSVDVLSTPRLLAWVEAACMEVVEARLGPGETSVGMRTQLDHIKPSVVGAEVVARAELERVEGRRLTFMVQAHDPKGQIATGRLTRVIVESARFLDRAHGAPAAP